MSKPNLTKALDELKQAMFNPPDELRNRYSHLTISQLEELIEEVDIEVDKLPPHAWGKLKVLQDEQRELQDALNSLINRSRADPSGASDV